MAVWQVGNGRGFSVGLVAVAAVLSVLLSVMPTSARSQLTWEPTEDGWVAGPVEHVLTVPEEAGGAVDGVLHDDYLYVSSWRSFSIYDVSEPLVPRRLSTVGLGPALYNEQPQTNGDILLLSLDLSWGPSVPGAPPGAPAGGRVLEIYDVSDKSDPQHIGRYTSAQWDHLWTCLDDCRYAYSAYGTILDLTDPTNPQRIGDWRDRAGANPRLLHHITEVAPGRVMVGSVPMFLLDTTDPAQPRVLATAAPPTTAPPFGLLVPESIPARVRWPQDTEDRFTLVTMETPFSSRCDDQSGKVHTFDTTDWDETGTFELVDTFQIDTNGTPNEGLAAHNVMGCGAYGSDVHPEFDDGGRTAVVFFEHGLRLLDIDGEGTISEVGGFLGHGGNSVAPIWVTDEILYSLDLHRGIDVLHVKTEE